MLPVQTNGLDILESLNFLVPDLGVTSVKLEHEGEELTFQLDFRTSENPDHSIKFELINELTMRIILTNWGGPFPTSTTRPISVGSIGGRKLSLLLAVNRLGENSEIRNVTLTAYLGSEVHNG